MHAAALLVVAVASGQTAAPATAELEARTAEVATAPLIETERGFVLRRPPVIIDGSILPVEVEAPAPCARAEVEWLGNAIELQGAGASWRALLPVPLGADRVLRLVVRCGKRAVRFRVPVREGEYPESKLMVDPKFMRQPPSRAAAEQASITRAYAVSAGEALWSQPFLRPTPGPETSVFGGRRTFNQRLTGRHRGLDYDGRVGAPVYAANEGVVVLAAVDYYFTGNAVFVDHGRGLFTCYYHLSRLDVRTGDRVQRGQLLGQVGTTGRVTGPHLHLGVKLLGHYVNPNDLWRLQPWADPTAPPVADLHP